jgi:hypothetical protein
LDEEEVEETFGAVDVDDGGKNDGVDGTAADAFVVVNESSHVGNTCCF